MTITESILIALFMMLVVFTLLGAVYALILLSSSLIRLFTGRKKEEKSSVSPEIDTVLDHTLQNEAELFSSGELKLTNVDEPTAAMIIAIVSDESGISLSELRFKSIRLVESNEQKTASQEAIS